MVVEELGTSAGIDEPTEEYSSCWYDLSSKGQLANQRQQSTLSAPVQCGEGLQLLQEGCQLIWWESQDLCRCVYLNAEERDESRRRRSFLRLGGNPQEVAEGLYAGEGGEAGAVVRRACNQEIV